jgi:hypothetical protein
MIKHPVVSVASRLAFWQRWPLLLPFAAFALAWLYFCWPWLTGVVTIPWDAKAQFAPQVQFMARSFHAGESPFWTPYAFAGMPQIADPQSLLFSPPFVMLALLNAAPSLQAIDITTLAMLLIGGWGLIWATRDLGWHWAGSLVAALGFAFGASMAWRLQHFGQVLSLAYWPFAWLFLRRALRDGSVGYGIAAGIMGAFIVLGRDQVGLLVIYALIGQVIWHVATSTVPVQAVRSSIKPLAACALTGLALVIIPITLTLLHSAQSNRPLIDYRGAAAGSLHPAHLVTTLIPHLFGAAGAMDKFWGPPSFTWLGTGLFTAQNMGQLYIGAVPVLLLTAGLVRGLFWARDIRFISCALVAATLYAFGSFTPLFGLLYEVLPGVKLYRRPADATFLMGGFASLLAGYAAHRLFSWDWPPPSPALGRWLAAPLPDIRGWGAGWCRADLLPVLAAVVFALLAALVLNRVDMALPPLLLAAAWLAAAAALITLSMHLKGRHQAAVAVALLTFSIVDLSWNNGPNGATALPVKEIDMLQPATTNETLTRLTALLQANQTATRRDRTELIGLGFHWPNASLTHGLEQTLGYNPVRSKLYVAATGAGDSSGGADQRKFTPLFPSYHSLMANMLGLRYIATGVPITEIDKYVQDGEFPLIARTADGYIYENAGAFPRVWFAPEAVSGDFARIIATGDWPTCDDNPRRAPPVCTGHYLTSVVLEAPTPPAGQMPPAGQGLTPPSGLTPITTAAAKSVGDARIIRYGNTVIDASATSQGGGWLVLNDLWHPWWFAELDGGAAPILRANVLFRAVAVPPGSHRVTFRFRPLAGAWRQLWER